MAAAQLPPPRIACIAIIGKHDNPLHIALFPPAAPDSPSYLDYSFQLSASLDLFDQRNQDPTYLSQDLGQLRQIDDRLSLWGWQTATGVRFIIIVEGWREGIDLRGFNRSKGEKAETGLKGAFRTLQTAYIHLLQDPFYDPDDHTPMAASSGRTGVITNRKFLKEVARIGESWKVGMSAV